VSATIAIPRDELLALLREAVRAELAEARRALRQPAPQVAMVAASVAEARYRKGHGEARLAWMAGTLEGEERPGRGRAGRTLWIAVRSAEALWGGGRSKDSIRLRRALAGGIRKLRSPAHV